VVQYATGEVLNYELGKIQSNAEGGQNNSHIVEQFVDSVLYDKEPPVPSEEGMKSLQVNFA
jgi:UDP-N-acetylglucosamine 3-dehydrogenase